MCNLSIPPEVVLEIGGAVDTSIAIVCCGREAASIGERPPNISVLVDGGADRDHRGVDLASIRRQHGAVRLDQCCHDNELGDLGRLALLRGEVHMYMLRGVGPQLK